MSDVDTLLSRRALLVGTVGTVAACSTKRHHSPDPDAAALAVARNTERDIVDATDASSPLRQVHLEHLRALGGEPPTAPASAPATAPAQQPATLVHDSVAALQAAAVAARRGSTAALLASVAASHSAMTTAAP